MDHGKGKCLVFLHGWGGEIASFQGLADRLFSEFRVVLIDLYGFGKTPHPPFALTVGGYAAGVRELLGELGVENAVLVGHSFGGRVAMRLAANDRNFAGVVLIDSAGILPRRGIKYRLRVAAYKIAKRLKLKTLPKGSEDYRKLSGVMKQTFLNVVNESSEKDACSISAPTLLLWGSRDKETPLYMCRRLNKLIKGSECVVMEGCGHFAYLEKADLTYRILRAFRRRV